MTRLRRRLLERPGWLALPLLLLLVACPGPNTNPPGLDIDPSSLTVTAGDPAQTFTATVTLAGGSVTWNLIGAGTIASDTGPTTSYLPPASVPAGTTATLTATLAGTAVSASAAITIDPVNPTSGNLQILVFNLDEPAAEAAITVSGPDGFARALTASQTLLDLAPGSYTVTAEAVRVVTGGLEAVREPEVQCQLGPAVTAAASSTCSIPVVAGETAHIAIDYTLVPGTGMLWIPSYNDGLVGGYLATQLTASNTDPAAVRIEGTPSAQGIAFDGSGRLWVSDWDANVLRAYLPEQLGGSGTPTPDVVLNGSGALMNPTALAFDADGGLWVTNRGNDTIVKYSILQLVTGNPAPAVVLRDDGSGNLSAPNGAAFDSVGRLWISNLFSGSLYRYDDPGSFSGDIDPSPDVILSSTLGASPSLDAPSGLAFDASGTLWVSDQALNTLVAFAPEQLDDSGTPEPVVTIAATGPSLASPNGLAFDASGRLWVSNEGGAVVAFAAEQLTASGAPEPEITLNGFSGVGLGFLAFDPPPSALPLGRR